MLAGTCSCTLRGRRHRRREDLSRIHTVSFIHVPRGSKYLFMEDSGPKSQNRYSHSLNEISGQSGPLGGLLPAGALDKRDSLREVMVKSAQQSPTSKRALVLSCPLEAFGEVWRLGIA